MNKNCKGYNGKADLHIGIIDGVGRIIHFDQNGLHITKLKKFNYFLFYNYYKNYFFSRKSHKHENSSLNYDWKQSLIIKPKSSIILDEEKWSFALEKLTSNKNEWICKK